MNGRTSQHSPTALVGDALSATGLQAGDQDATQHGQPPRARKTGYVQLLAAEALPQAFLEETCEDTLIYTEAGDQQVRQAVLELKQAVTRYNVCWCSAPEELAGDLYRLWVAPTPELLVTRRALPLFFTHEELQAALRIDPVPRRPLHSSSPSVQTVLPGAVATPDPELSTPSPASTSAQGTQSERITVYASLKTIRWAWRTLERRTKEQRLPFHLRQLWLLRAALQAIMRDHQRLADLPGTDYKVRRVLVCRAEVRPEHIKLEPCYEDGQLVGFELAVTVPPELLVAA